MLINKKENNSTFRGSLSFIKTKSCSNPSKLGKTQQFFPKIILSSKLSVKKETFNSQLNIFLSYNCFINIHLSNIKKLLIFIKQNRPWRSLSICNFYLNNLDNFIQKNENWKNTWFLAKANSSMTPFMNLLDKDCCNIVWK